MVLRPGMFFFAGRARATYCQGSVSALFVSGCFGDGRGGDRGSFFRPRPARDAYGMRCGSSVQRRLRTLCRTRHSHRGEGVGMR